MTRLQKKCLVGSACFHGLTVAVFLATAAFRSEPAITEGRVLTLIPTRMYFKNGRVKVELALAKGKQLWDKRETERRKTADREARDAIARGHKGR